MCLVYLKLVVDREIEKNSLFFFHFSVLAFIHFFFHLGANVLLCSLLVVNAPQSQQNTYLDSRTLALG